MKMGQRRSLSPAAFTSSGGMTETEWRSELFNPLGQSLAHKACFTNGYLDLNKHGKRTLFDINDHALTTIRDSEGYWEGTGFCAEQSGLTVRLIQKQDNGQPELQLLAGCPGPSGVRESDLFLLVCVHKPWDKRLQRSVIVRPFATDGETKLLDRFAKPLANQLVLYCFQARAKGKRQKTVSHLFLTRSHLSAATNPACQNAQSSTELQHLLTARRMGIQFSVNNLRFTDITGTRFPAHLETVATRSRVVSKEIWRVNPLDQPFHWESYSEHQPLEVQIPFEIRPVAMLCFRELTQRSSAKPSDGQRRPGNCQRPGNRTLLGDKQRLYRGSVAVGYGGSHVAE